MDKRQERLLTRLDQVYTQFAYIPQALQLVWSAAPKWTVAWLIALAIQGTLPAASVYLTRLLVDSLVVSISSRGWDSIRFSLILAVLIAGIQMLAELLQSATGWIRTAQAEFIQDQLSALIHEKAVEADLAFYESPDYFDQLHRASYDAKTRPLSLLESSGSLLQNSITLIAMGAILLAYGFWLPVALILSTLPALYVVLRFNRRYHRWWEQTTPDRRRIQYFDAMLTNSMVAAELRLFDLGAPFRSAFRALRQKLRTERLDITRDQGLAQLGAGFIGILVTGAAMIWIVWRAFTGLATLGDIALFYQAFNRGQTLMRSLLQNIGQIYSNGLFLGNLFEFLKLKPQVTDPAEPLVIESLFKKDIRFQNITFRYPGSERTALNDFNLTIPAGQIVAIVGANGAGKSTLIKLLCRFYDVEAGSIEADGHDIRNFSLKELRRQITVLFQNPVPYQDTAAQNIGLSDFQAGPGLPEIEAAARGAGAHEIIERLPKGYDTQLGKWFAGGAELSGGEWQRVALARAFLRQAQIVVLDEPTSFMDSWAEADWLARFRKLVQGRTAIIITHRFTTAMQADVIHVMEQGQIIESGSHAELLAQGGRYAQSWRAQMGAGFSSPERVPQDESSIHRFGGNGHWQSATVSSPGLTGEDNA